MKKIFTKTIGFVAAVVLFMGITMQASAQFTKKVLESGNSYYSAMTRDGAGNVYAIKCADGVHASVIKFLAGQLTYTTIFTGLHTEPEDERGGDQPWGLAVNGSGDVYVSTDFSGSNTGVTGLHAGGNIIKLATNNGFSGTAYTPSIYQNATVYYTALAFDSNNNLYACQYDADASHSEIVEYAAGAAASSAGTVLVTNLNDELTDNYPHNLAIASNFDIFVTNSPQQDNSSSTTHVGADVRRYTKASNYASFTQVSVGKYASALALDPAGNLYVSETDGSKYTHYQLNKYTAGTGTPTMIVALDNNAGVEPDGIAAVSATNVYVLDGGNPGAIWEETGPATVQAHDINFTSINTTTTTVNWTNGDGDKRAVFIAAASTGAPTVANNTTYTANAAFGSGTAAGAGWYCIYTGTGTSVPVTGLTQGTTYIVKVDEYNGPAGGENYLTTTGTNNPNTVTTLAPVALSSLVAASANPTNATTVQYTATFAGPITGLTAANFSVSVGGSVTATAIGGVSGSGSVYTITVNTGSGSGTLRLNLSTALGISPGVTNAPYTGGDTYTIDKAAPVSTSASVSPSSGTYGAAQLLSFTVGFGENVTVNTSGGTPTIPVTFNSGAVTAAYTSGSGTSTLTFSYTTVAGNNDNDGITIGNAISLNGATIKDNVGNDATLTFTAPSGANIFIDTEAPAAPSIPLLASGSETGTSSSDGITKVPAPIFHGTAEAGTIVKLYDTDGTTFLGSGTATVGTWAIHISALSEGAHTIYARATDVAGNTSAPSIGASITIDTTAPTLLITSDVSTLKQGQTATITFTFSEDPSSTFTWNGSTGDVTVSGGTLSAISGTGLTRTATFTPTDLVNSGTASIRVAASSYTDIAGNNGGAGTTPSLTYDTQPPAAPSAPILASGSDSGTSNSDGLTNDTTPTFTGTAAANTTIMLYDGGTYLNVSTPSDGSGNWSVTSSALTEGVHSISANSTDAAGNSSPLSSATSVTIDVTAPTVSITSNVPALKAGQTADITFTFSEDPGVTFTWDGSAGDIVVSGGTLSAISGAGLSRSAVFTPGTGVNGGTASITIAAGSYTDAAGNGGNAGSTPSLTFDTQAPNAPSTPVLATADDSGSSNSDGITNVTTPTFTGTAEAGATVTLYDTDGTTELGSGVATGGNWSIPSSALAAANHTITAKATDAAGNTGASSAGLGITIDTSAPTASSLIYASSNTNTQIAVSGDAVSLEIIANEPISTPTVTIAGHTATIVQNSTTDYTASYTMTAGDSEGRIAFTALFTDIAGNTSATYTDSGAGDDIEFDNTAPAATSVTFASSNSDPTTANIGDVVTISFTTNKTVQLPTATIAGHLVTVSNTSGNDYTATYTMASGDASGNIAFNVNLKDAGGLTSNFTNVSSGKNVVYNNTPTIAASGTLSAVNTVYGTASATPATFTVSAFNLSTGILVSPPTGFEVSKDGSSFSSTVTIGTGGATPSTTVYVRLAATTIPGTYAGDVLLTANGATDGHVATASSTVGEKLNSLALSAGTLSPAFSGGTTAYTASVTGISTITVTPTDAESQTSLQIRANSGTYQTITSGSTSDPLTLNVGNNAIDVKATSQDGTVSKVYTVTVNRIQSANAILTELNFTPYVVRTRVEGSHYRDYTATVKNGVDAVTVTPVTADPTATVTVNGETVASGAASSSIPLRVGRNTITTIVTAEDGTTIHTYVMKLSREPSPVAILTSIAYDPNIAVTTVTPRGSTNYRDYTSTVNYAVSSIKVMPVTADTTTKVKVNGHTVASGASSAAIALVVGQNTINTVVTAGDGVTTNTYSIVITRLPSTDATLTSLNFNPNIAKATVTGTNYRDYTSTVSNAVSSIQVTPVTANATATVTVNGTPVTSGSASASLPLTVGTNTITTVVIAGDGSTTNTYSTVITRLPSTNATLTSLAFNPNIPKTTVTGPDYKDYTSAVNYGISSVTVTPVTADATSTVTVNGTPVISGSASASLPLAVGSNTITTIVTAGDGTTSNTYSVVITRAASTNATLVSLNFNPNIAKATVTGPDYKDYTSTVNNAISSIQVTPVTVDNNATVTVNGHTVLSGSASPSLPLSVGANTINTIVTAADGTTSNTYSTVITRLPATNATLVSLNFNPNIAKATVTGPDYRDYTSTVNNAVSSIQVTPVTVDNTATVTVNGHAVSSGSASPSLPLAVGANTITTVVTAGDGSTSNTYSTVITRLPATNATLSTLTFNPNIAKTTVTGPDYRDYTSTVNNAVSSIQVTPVTADNTATVTVNGHAVTSGTASQALPLSVGANTITTIVTAGDGSTSNTYSVVITRQPATNAELSALTFNPNIAKTTVTGTHYKDYTSTVNNAISPVQVTPVTVDNTATVTVNGASVTSGSASASIPLAVGANTVTTIVTAGDGSTSKTYSVVITRQPATNAELSSMTFNPNIAKTTVTGPNFRDYTSTVSNAVSSITETPVAVDNTATITVNGHAVTSGSASQAIPLAVGTNTITTVVTAGNGSTSNTYSVVITRLPSTDATLTAFNFDPFIPRTQVSGSHYKDYTASVSNAIESVTVTPVTADAGSTVKVNGQAVTSGSASQLITLNVGTNTVGIVVTAPDGTTKNTYAIVITRAASNVAILSSFTFTPYVPRTEVSGSNYKDYTADVSNAVDSVRVTAVAAEAGETIKVNNQAVTSGSLSQRIFLQAGGNTTVAIKVTAADGTTTHTYSIVISRALPPASLVQVGQDKVVLDETAPVLVHQAVSPNSDGKDDYLMIEGIANHPDNTLQIMNRSGVLVYQAKGYDNASKVFDGHASTSGKLQQPGTYFYSLDYKAGGETKHKTGYIILKY